MVEIVNYIEAATSLGKTFLASPCEGRLRKISLAAMDYCYKASEGEKMTPAQRNILGIMLTLGKNINDYYDTGIWESKKYKKLRKEFKRLLPERNDDFIRYQQTISRIEKNRPTPSHLMANPDLREKMIVDYRERLNWIYLAFSFSLAHDRPISNYYEDYDNNSDKHKNLFRGYFNSLMALQVVDDIVGRYGDLVNDRPSFYTAVCSHEEILNKFIRKEGNDTYQKIENIFEGYYLKAKGCPLRVLKPVLTVVRLTKNIYPKLTELSRKTDLLKKAPGVDPLSLRDRCNL